MSYSNVYAKVIPVGLALAPIGILFGVLAAQENWNFLEVFLMSIIGFSGSGQFTYLGFVNQGIDNIEFITVFVVILSINLRYIPMSLSASNNLKTNIFKKCLLSHFLADESYAIEKKDDDLTSRTIIRLTIVLLWAISTSVGVLLANYIPESVNKILLGLTFPVNAILILLSVSNVIEFRKNNETINNAVMITSSLLVSILMILILGAKYFWIPSIAISYYILKRYQKI